MSGNSTTSACVSTLEPGLRDGSDVDTSEWIDTPASRRATHAARARQASGRRRMVDPTTCERDYNAEELEFLRAMQEYKKMSGRMFPTWSEVLEVVRGLGYEKAARAN